MKPIHMIIAALFALFAVLQWNDADSHLWIPIYGFVAAAAALAAAGRYFPWVTMAGALVLGAFMLSYVPEFLAWLRMGGPSIVETMKAEKPYVESTREFLGLTLCVGALLYYFYLGRAKDRTMEG